MIGTWLKRVAGVIFPLLFFILSQDIARSEEQVITKDQSESSVQESVSPKSLPVGAMGPVTLRGALHKGRELPLTLEQALQLAEGHSIRIEIGKELLQQSRLDTMYRISDLLPDVTAEYRQSRFVGGVQIFGGELFSLSRTTYQPQLTANYTLYPTGKNLLEIRASRQRQEAQRNLTEETRQETLSQVALAYYDLQQAYWRRAIILQAIQETELQVSLNQSRFDAGVGLKLDLLQAQTTLSEKKQDLLLAENEISKAAERLSQLLTLDLDVDLVPETLESTIRSIAPEISAISNLIETAMQYNPRLKALRNLRDAGKTDVRIAIADIFPQFNITGYINGTGPGFDSLGLSRFAGLQVSMDMLENLGLGRPLKIRQARSNSRIAELTLTQAKRLLQEDLANIIVDLKTLENRVQVAKERIGFAKAAYEQALMRLQEGIGTNIDLENSITRLTNARVDLANTFLDYNKAQVGLLFKLGLVSVTSLTQGYQADGTIALPFKTKN